MMTAQYQAALHSYAEGQYEEAMQQFSELLYEDPRNPKLHIWLGATFRKAGKIEYAKVQYQKVLTLTDDPDLLDLANTSLAQIQNKLALSAQKAESIKSASKDPDSSHKLHEPSSQQKIPQVMYPQVNAILGTSRLADNGIASNSDLAESSEDQTLLLDSNGNVPNNVSVSKPQNAIKISNGVVPPPPVIASLLNKQQQVIMPEEHSSETLIFSDKTMEWSTNPLAPSSVLQDTIATLQNNKSQDGKTGKNKKIKNQVKFPPLESEAFIAANEQRNPEEIVSNKSANSSASAFAIEDMLKFSLKFSTVGQKITLWGALVATIPALILGGTAYKVGDSLLLAKVKQAQQSEAITLAKITENFLHKQASDVGVLKTLLVSAEVGQNTLQDLPITPNLSEPNRSLKLLASLPINQQRQYKQLLTNRLNLYSQAYPQYTSIAIFSTNGELLAQSNKSKILQTINPNLLNKATTSDNVLISDPVAVKDGASLYAVTSLKSSVSQKIGLILQVEIPIKSLVSELSSNKYSNGKSNFYLIDNSNKYIASSQTVTLGEDALTDFAILPSLRSFVSNDLPEIVKGDRNPLILAYATVSNMQSYGMAWDIVTTIDKSTAISGHQNLLLVIGIGIATTPLLVATISYALSRRLSNKLKDIRTALRDLSQGNTHTSLRSLSVEGNDELADISLSINNMSGQFQVMMQKQEQERKRLQSQVVKMFKVLSKLAREEKQEIKDDDISDLNIMKLGKKIRQEMVQRNAEVANYRQQKADLQAQLVQMLKDVQALADGDLTVSTKSIDGNLNNVPTFFDDVIRGLLNIVMQVKSSASQVNLSLGQNEQAIASLTSVSQRQIDTVTRSLNTVQMAKISANSITTISQNVLKSSQIFAEKLSESDRSIDAVMTKVGELQGTVVNTAKRVKHLGEVSQKIAKAISAINEIAIKTNFLAINASLESSRSGDMGNGFAIVAEEVGELAARSVAATKEVEGLLSSIQIETSAVMTAVASGSSQAAESVQLATSAKDSLLQISHISQQIEELASSISDATISQVQTSEGVANLMKDISHIAKRNLAASLEVSKFFKTTKGCSGDLLQALTKFKT